MFDPTVDPQLRSEILTRVGSQTMTDRERARLFGLPDGCRIREGAKILAPQKLKMGRDCWIGEHAVLDAQGGLEIGDSCQIGLYTMIWTHSSHRQALAGETGTSRDKIEYKPTKIGSNVFIAGPSVVLAGVTIGDGALISPMSLVDRDIPAGGRFNAQWERRQLEKRVAELEQRLGEDWARRLSRPADGGERSATAS